MTSDSLKQLMVAQRKIAEEYRVSGDWGMFRLHKEIADRIYSVQILLVQAES